MNRGLLLIGNWYEFRKKYYKRLIENKLGTYNSFDHKGHHYSSAFGKHYIDGVLQDDQSDYSLAWNEYVSNHEEEFKKDKEDFNDNYLSCCIVSAPKGKVSPISYEPKTGKDWLPNKDLDKIKIYKSKNAVQSHLDYLNRTSKYYDYKIEIL